MLSTLLVGSPSLLAQIRQFSASLNAVAVSALGPVLSTTSAPPPPHIVVNRELEKECIIVFDEAHNIDNVCIESLSVNLRQATLDGASRNITKLANVRRTA